MVAFVKPLGTAPDVVPLVAFVPSAARLPPGKFKYNNSVPVGGKFVDPNTIASEAAPHDKLLQHGVRDATIRPRPRAAAF